MSYVVINEAMRAAINTRAGFDLIHRDQSRINLDGKRDGRVTIDAKTQGGFGYFEVLDVNSGKIYASRRPINNSLTTYNCAGDFMGSPACYEDLPIRDVEKNVMIDIVGYLFGEREIEYAAMKAHRKAIDLLVSDAGKPQIMRDIVRVSWVEGLPGTDQNKKEGFLVSDEEGRCSDNHVPISKELPRDGETATYSCVPFGAIGALQVTAVPERLN